MLIDLEFDGGYISNLLSNDWGFEKTVLQNLVRITDHLESIKIDPALKVVSKKRIQDLNFEIEGAKKSLSYKLRAKIGEKMPWYEEPEELSH